MHCPLEHSSELEPECVFLIPASLLYSAVQYQRTNPVTRPPFLTALSWCLMSLELSDFISLCWQAKAVSQLVTLAVQTANYSHAYGVKRESGKPAFLGEGEWSYWVVKQSPSAPALTFKPPVHKSSEVFFFSTLNLQGCPYYIWRAHSPAHFS